MKPSDLLVVGNVSNVPVFALMGLLAWLQPAAAEQISPGWEASAPVAVAPEAVRDGQVVQRQPSAAFGKGVYLVAWCDGARKIDQPAADIYCARIDAATGRTLDPGGIRVCSAADLQEWPTVAFDGVSFLVAWQDFRSGSHYDVYAARVSPEGKVLDPDGFAVSAGPSNQCRPGAAAAGGNWVVVWMDARVHPLYGIYGARVSPEGRVLDPEGLPLDTEDAEKIAKARPPQARWMGEHDYWWQNLSSRYVPAIASNGDKCLVAYLREYPFAQMGRPVPTGLVLDGREGRVEVAPVKLPGGAYDALAVCATPRGWAMVLADHAQGWDLTAQLAAVRLDAQLNTGDAFAKPDSREPDKLPVENLQKSLMPEKADGLNPGKGALAFWRPAAAWDGRHVVMATDFGWRTHGDATAISYVIAVNRLALEGRTMVGARSAVAASTQRADQAVANPALASSPDGRALLVFERDEAVDRQVIHARLLRETTPGGPR